eukprot:TRINITY_DN2168_c0_g1_i1.p1 TRINITY_DN2168_c0_g1~~TRINITY_DN2168_c0_g1_i1.p1  ORF type:complete len:445 (+),score=47.02 TRINITY_DN2168_c0_g1_i1:22-1356(+)
MPKQGLTTQQPDELTTRWSNIETNIQFLGHGLDKLQNSETLHSFVQEARLLLRLLKQIKCDTDMCIKLSASQTTSNKRQKTLHNEQVRNEIKSKVEEGIGKQSMLGEEKQKEEAPNSSADQLSPGTDTLPQTQPTSMTVPTPNPTPYPTLPPTDDRMVNPTPHPPQQPQMPYPLSSQQVQTDCQQLRVVLSTPQRPPTLRGTHQGAVSFPQTRPRFHQVPQSFQTALSIHAAANYPGIQQPQVAQIQHGLTLQQQLASIQQQQQQHHNMMSISPRVAHQGLGTTPLIMQSVSLGGQNNGGRGRLEGQNISYNKQSQLPQQLLQQQQYAHTPNLPERSKDFGVAANSMIMQSASMGGGKEGQGALTDVQRMALHQQNLANMQIQNHNYNISLKNAEQVGASPLIIQSVPVSSKKITNDLQQDEQANQVLLSSLDAQIEQQQKQQE